MANKQKKVAHLHAAQNGKCYFCKCDTYLLAPNQNKMNPNTATIEHLVPKSKGGTNVPANLKMSCHNCNSLRGSMHAVEWLRIVQDPQKMEQFLKTKELKKMIKNFKYKKKFKERMLKRTGVFYTYITVPQNVFNKLFEQVI